MPFLDYDGLSHFLDKCKGLFSTKDVATPVKSGLMSDADKRTLDSINTNNFKPIQAQVATPASSGNAVDFIDTIQQYPSGVIAPTRKRLDVATDLKFSNDKLTHNNTVTATTTQAVYPITIDANGHVKTYGPAATILTLGNASNQAARGDHTHDQYVQTTTLNNRVPTNGSAGQVLTSTGSGTNTWQNVEGLSLGTGHNQAARGDHTHGQYADATTLDNRVPANGSSGQVLTATGTGTNAWQNIEGISLGTGHNEAARGDHGHENYENAINSINLLIPTGGTSGQVLTATNSTSATWQTPQTISLGTTHADAAYGDHTHDSYQTELTRLGSLVPSGGTNGQVLMATNSTTASWQNPGTPSSAQVNSAVTAWLESNPSATTGRTFNLSNVPYLVGSCLDLEGRNEDMSSAGSIPSEYYYVRRWAPYSITHPIAVGVGTRIDYNGTVSGARSNPLWIIQYDENFNVVNAMDYGWISSWTADRDCYIRIGVWFKNDSYTMTDSDMLNILSNTIMCYNQPTNKNIYSFNYTSRNIKTEFNYLRNITHDWLFIEQYREGNEYERWSNGRVLTDFYPVGKGTVIYIPDYTISDTDKTANKLMAYFYDKNLNPITGTWTWASQDVAKQDCYVRVAIRKYKADTVISQSDFDKVKTWIECDYVAPTDPDFLEPIEIRRNKAIKETTNLIYGESIQEASLSFMKMNEPKRLGYLWVSDIHVNGDDLRFSYNTFISKRILSAAVKTAEDMHLDFICVGGDLFDWHTTADNAIELINNLIKPLAESTVPVIFLLGNHDTNVYGPDGSSSTYNTVNIPWNKVIAIIPQRSEFHNDIVYGDVEHDGYFYFDIPTKHKRIVCLNGNSPDTGTDTARWWCINKAQVKWFCETACHTENDIVILTHTPPGTKYGTWNHGDEGGYYTALGDAITAYNLNASYSFDGETYNFSFDHGHVKHIHCGHTHVDIDPTYEPYSWGGVPVIITSCAQAWGQYADSSNTADPRDTDLYYQTQAQATSSHANASGYRYYLWTDRQYGTIKECLFDVVSMNSTNVHCFRIGAGHDRDYTI